MSSLISIITASAKAAHVPASLLVAICTHESHLSTVIVPHDGNSASYGICQIKEKTARGMGYANKLYTNKLRKSSQFLGAMEPIGIPTGLLNPSTNAYYAGLYLKKQLERYDGDWCKATAAYNSGTYLPSKDHPGKPKNYRYIKKIVLHLDEDHRDFLVCGERKIADE